MRVALVQLPVHDGLVGKDGVNPPTTSEPIRRLVVQGTREALELSDERHEELAVELMGPPSPAATTACGPQMDLHEAVEPIRKSALPISQRL